ncbi:hypothetical protein [Geoglobus acetivorans]|uniref:Uncharacterized protein n=1 Tax=Geoglobus acetivorans TaxID=565033 RepID=A0ABZ3H3F6_GEOAI|nr:hypothetical protein [Geoglobus acetivorans]
MSQAFRAVKFDYDQINEWKYYFSSIKDLAKSCRKIGEFWRELKRKCDGISFKELQEDWDYSSVLLGGVSADGIYKERSLAKVYCELFGFKPENVRDLIEKLKEELPPTTKVLVEETKFISFVMDISSKVETILEQAKENDLISDWEAEIKLEYNYYEILSDYKKLTEMLSDFIRRLKDILPNYNQRSLFIWTLDRLTYRYMTAAYPKLKAREALDMIKDIFGLDVIFSPEIEGATEEVRKKKEQYEVYSFLEGSLGRNLIELYKTIWDAFNDGFRKSLTLVFPEVPNLKEEFYEMAAQALKSIGWKFPSYTWENEFGHTTTHTICRDRYKYRISGILLTSYNYWTTKKYWSTEHKCNIPLLQLLDDISPALFLLSDMLFKLKFEGDILEIEPTTRAYEWIHQR